MMKFSLSKLLILVLAFLLAFYPVAGVHAEAGAGVEGVISTLVSPSGVTSDSTPTFIWSVVGGALKYELKLFRSGTLVYSKIIMAGNCGASYCSSTPATALKNSTYYWKVKAYVGGKWQNPSAPKYFSVGTGGASSYQFTSSPSLATWTSGAGAVSFGSSTPNAAGVAYLAGSVQMEDGSTYSLPALVMIPQDVTSGSLSGVFQSRTVAAGDRFRASIGCVYGATNCYVRFILDAQVGDAGSLVNLMTYSEHYEGLLREVSVDLSSLAGKSVKFILKVSAYNGRTGSQCSAAWLSPRIAK